MVRMKFTVAVLVWGLLTTLVSFDAAESQVGQSQGLVNPDLANEKELLVLPHMNASLVKSIMEQRPFLTMSEYNALLAKSLTKEQLTELYGKAFIQLNLNTASEEEILMIPGLG
ncbi:MAG TPA: hypothetical protein VFN20_09610, partial [Candidatus Acidoferrum sp.]|nr:hypothetical protein [Candidatus Acidoferrum sp.]